METSPRSGRIFLRKIDHAPLAGMQLKMLAIRIKNVSEAEAERNGFLRGHRVLAVKKEFVPDGENSFWTFCVRYLDGAAAATGSGSPGPRPPKVDYKEVLKPEEFELLSRMREWRKDPKERSICAASFRERVLHHALSMDDFVVWGGTAAELRAVWRQVEAFLAAELRLELKPNVMPNRSGRGMDFLGFRAVLPPAQPGSCRAPGLTRPPSPSPDKVIRGEAQAHGSGVSSGERPAEAPGLSFSTTNWTNAIP